VRRSIAQNSDLIGAWRVLGAESSGTGQFIRPDVDLAVLAVPGRSILMVVRIDGRIESWDMKRTARSFADMAAKWGSRLPESKLSLITHRPDSRPKRTNPVLAHCLRHLGVGRVAFRRSHLAGGEVP
jgi:hypothetical protein